MLSAFRFFKDDLYVCLHVSCKDLIITNSKKNKTNFLTKVYIEFFESACPRKQKVKRYEESKVQINSLLRSVGLRKVLLLCLTRNGKRRPCKNTETSPDCLIFSPKAVFYYIQKPDRPYAESTESLSIEHSHSLKPLYNLQ